MADDPRVTKRRVTMTNYRVGTDPTTGERTITREQAMDYVRPDFLDAYVDNAKLFWEDVTVSEEPDAGPGGYDGQTVIPAALDHPDAGAVFAATQED